MQNLQAPDSFHWINKDTSFFRRFITRGKSLMGGRFIITLKTPRIAGFHCEISGLTMLKNTLTTETPPAKTH